MSDRPFYLMLVDGDATFRTGLRVCLEQLGFAVVAEVSSGAEALEEVRSRQQSHLQAFDSPAQRPPLPLVDLVILGLDSAQPDANGLELCGTFKAEFPSLSILLLSDAVTPVIETAARQMGASAVGSRSMPVRQLAQLVAQVVRGETEPLAPVPGPFTAMRQSMRLSGLQQIDQTLQALRQQRQQPLSQLQQIVIDGRMRELRAARWWIGKIWATPRFESAWEATPANPRQTNPRQTSSRQVNPRQAIRQASGAIAPTPPTAALASPAPGLQTAVLDSVFAKLQTGLDNRSPEPLEIDILNPDKKRELLFTILRQLEDLLGDLRQSQPQPGQLPEKTPQILSDLWEQTIEAFFGKYYTVRLSQVEQEVVAILQREKSVVEAEILSHIPLVPELLAHWLFQESLLIDGSPYLAATPEAIGRSEQLLENLLIQMANAVMQPLLNRLADVETIKKSFYSRRLMSTRDIERFRNELAWRTRLDRLVNEPRAIFESQYRLWVLTPFGINRTSIYAPRRDELDQLSGLQWAVTMALETRDALAPRVRAAIAFVGSGVVYVLTKVVGRGIGLIGRGVLQGIGSAWQDTRRGKRSSDRGGQDYKGFNEWE